MRFTIVPSSHLYPFCVADCLKLEDSSIDFSTKGEISILLGDCNSGVKDTLLCGREQLLKMAQDSVVDVRVYFSVEVKWSAFLSLFKYFKNRNKRFGTEVYHINPLFLRETRLERCVRTAENAYKTSFFNADSPLVAYQLLSEKLKEGFDDRYPLTVMLHRKKRHIDSLEDGHHRLGLCIQHNLPHVGIKFCYASSLEACLNILLWRKIYRL